MPGRFCLIIIALLAITACNSKDTSSPNSNTPANLSPATTTSPATSSSSSAGAVKSKVDPCSLLTSDDLKSVQGEAYQDAQRSDRQDGDFIVAQCYYALPTMANSVVLNVTTAREGAGATSPRKFWEQTFGKDEGQEKSAREREKEKEQAQKNKAQGGGEENEEGPKPEKINGLGDEAFWIASRVGGALYVLKGDQFFRISIGGAGDVKSKLTKSKTLAQSVLKRI